jgi:predicted DNA-binding transcriptional regulator AlpA
MSDLSSLPPELMRSRILDSAQTAEFIGLSLPHFRRRYRAGTAPIPIKIGERKFGWRVGDLVDWLDDRSRQTRVSEPEAA